MKPMHFAMALLSAVMFFVLAGVMMGVQLSLSGTKLVVDIASSIRWEWIAVGTAVVFLFQLLRPFFQKSFKKVSGPKFILPAIDGSTAKQNCFWWRCWCWPLPGRLWYRAGRWISPP
ncbi:high-affinity branched-chain amino acid ABC transporter permease [Atlantibacter hermannii]|nr:high-affinity branched-chain amino acid ABC transporter permease [Atlantibacter hermannii]